jgi:hypothetical protein
MDPQIRFRQELERIALESSQKHVELLEKVLQAIDRMCAHSVGMSAELKVTYHDGGQEVFVLDETSFDKYRKQYGKLR